MNVKFDYCLPECNDGRLLKDDVRKLLFELPFVVGHDIYVTSAFRSVDWELSHGRSGTSSHCSGYAVDIQCQSSLDRHHILDYLFRKGIRRVGISKTFIHFDTDPTKLDSVWLY